MLYTFNLMVGLEPNGVDVAQAYRGKVFRDLGLPACFVFTQVPPRFKWDYYLSLGHLEEEILLAHMLLTDQRDMSLGIRIDDMKQLLHLTAEYKENNCEVIFQEQDGVTTILHKNSLKPDYVDYVDYYVFGRLLRREHYGKKKLFTEFFTAVDAGFGIVARVVRRLFHNRDGSIAFEEIKKEPGEDTEAVYRCGSEWFYSESEFLERALSELQFSKEDHVFIDRLENLPFTSPLLRLKGEARLSCVVHSIHYWGDQINSEYYHLFQYAEEFDDILVSTQSQKDELEKHLALLGKTGQVRVLPVAALEQLQLADERKPYSVMIAVRFERRKRLDLAIKAIVAFHEIFPDVNLDIYGQGMLWQDIEAEIANLGAQNYIHLKGHQTISNRFKEYELYLATSEWETFGITLLEAIGSGQALVGLDVPYGNQTFIQEGKNGYLVPFAARSDEEIVVDLTKALEKAFKQIKQLREGSYRLAEEYLSDRIIKQWYEFLTREWK